jgi:proline-specific peptidase
VEEGYLDAPDGRIWYRRVGRGGVPLLTLHGGPSIGGFYIAPMARLADEREVIFFDLIGCGRSDILADPTRYSVPYYVEQVEWVRKRLGVERFHVFGNSWGGILGTYYLSTFHPDVLSFTVSNSIGDFARHHRELKELTERLPPEVRETIRWHEATGNVSCPEYVGAIAVVWQRHTCRLVPWPQELEDSFPVRDRQASVRLFGQGRFALTGLLKDETLFSLYPKIQCPLLFVAGRFDMCDPEHMRDMHKAAAGSEFMLFEESSHLPFIEEPELFFSRYRDYLARVERGEVRPRAS